MKNELWRSILSDKHVMSRRWGWQIDRDEAGTVILRILTRSEFLGNPDRGVMHDGVIAVLLDTVCGLAMFEDSANEDQIATLDLRIDFLRAASIDLDVMASARVDRIGRAVAFVSGFAHQGDPENPIAKASATFMTLVERTGEQGERRDAS